MKKILLTTLLLTGAAQGQTAPTSGSPTVLHLKAPVGSVVELLTTSTTRVTMADPQVTAVPGAKVDEAKLAQARKSVTKSGALTIPPVTATGKAFYKVAARDAAGNVTLVTTIVQNPPKAEKGKQEPPLTMKMTLVVPPDGRASVSKIESDNKMMNDIFKSLTPDKLQKMAEQAGSNFEGVYAVPWAVGQRRTKALSVNAQDMLGSMFTAFAGAQGQAMFDQLKSSPLNMTFTTTYNGLNAAGQHSFTTDSTAQDWKFSMQMKDKDMPAFSVQARLLDLKTQATSFYRKDGLPLGGDQTTSMTIKMTMTMEGIQTVMTMKMDQQMTMRPR